MIFGSVCSGIEAASVAWYPLGWRAAWLSEIEPFPCDVLAHHYPDVPNLGDMTTIADYVRLGLVDAPDVLVGGTPCQAFSVAGLRGGLSDARGQLTLEFVRLADEIDRKRNDGSIVVWENVPGVLSSKDNAFGCFLAGLACASVPLSTPSGRWPNAGFIVGSKRAIAWRVLDAQFFGVAQRRRRVFVVASSRAGFDPAKVLFEFDSVRRNTPPGREARQETAGTLASRTGAGGFPGTDEACSGYIQAVVGALTAKGPTTNGAPEVDAGHVFATVGALDTECGFQKSTHQSINAGHLLPIVGNRMVAFGEYAEDETASCMKARDYKDATDLVAYGIPGNWIGRAPENGGNATEPMHGVVADMQVRRLTPTECERLQGFPDGYTLVPVKGKPAADGPRYKALGNSMAVPCMRWIGEQIVKQF